MKLLSVCFFKGGFFPSTFYKSATFEEGKDSSGLALGFSTMQYSNETLLDGSSIEKSRFWLSWKFFVKHGISEYFGLSLKTNLASVITDAKYQYFDGEVLDMAFDLGIGTTSFPQIRDNETVYDTYYSIYPAALIT